MKRLPVEWHIIENQDIPELLRECHITEFNILKSKDTEQPLLNVSRIDRRYWRLSLADDSSTALDGLERAGIVDYITEFFPASGDPELPHASGKIDSMNIEGYNQMFTRITQGKFLVPDTCLLINRVVSRRIVPIMGDDFPSRIRLSRISILEMESLHRIKQHLSLIGFCEVRDLTKSGATLMDPLPWSVILEYSNILKTAEARRESDKESIKLHKPIGDPAIRKEVLDYYMSTSSGDGSVHINGENIPIIADKPLLITNDMVFAYAAFGEDISSISFQRVENGKEWTIEEFQIPLVIFELAFSFPKIIVDGFKNTILEFKATWKGRTFFDLFKNRLMWREISH